jgi:DNA repair protein RecN (Recombination protein N)
MLTRLTVKDYVLIDRLELDVERGFTVLTGETGAGKSIVLGAIGLILGGRADIASIRVGASKADIAAEFEISALPHVLSFLENADLDTETCVLRRAVDATGRSRAWINGVPVTVKQLKEIGALLVDIHGQHEHYSLMDSRSHSRVLDSFGNLIEATSDLKTIWRNWQFLRDQLCESLQRSETLRKKTEDLAETKKELEDLDFSHKEWEQTLDRHRKLSNLSELTDIARRATDLLEDGEQNVMSTLSSVRSRLAGAAEIDALIGPMVENLESMEIQLAEFNRDFRRYAESLEAEPNLVAILDKRIAEVQRCARKHSITPDELAQYVFHVNSELEKISAQTNIAQLEKEESEAQKKFLSIAEKLSIDRKIAADVMTKKVNLALKGLAMSGVQFEARIIPNSEPEATGLENVEFYVSTNPGSEAKLIGRVASGGELSRISLAIQSVIYEDSAIPTVIFDEVDSGVGGAVAEIVGRMLKTIGETAQVLCVTHLPQVAAVAEFHWTVAKVQSNSASTTQVERLESKARIDEVARMLAGEVITEEARAHAQEMMRLGLI